MGSEPIPLRDGLQINDDRAVVLLERVTHRLAEFHDEHDQIPVDIAFVIRGERGAIQASWSIQSPDVRPMLALAGVMLAQEAVE